MDHLAEKIHKSGQLDLLQKVRLLARLESMSLEQKKSLSCLLNEESSLKNKASNEIKKAGLEAELNLRKKDG